MSADSNRDPALPSSVKPLPEAYSRVTNPERFSGLHNLAEDTIRRFRREFDVEIIAEPPSPIVLRSVVDATRILKSVKVRPHSNEAAPIHITFTDFPALVVEYGNGIITGYPSCGCDACAEIYEDEAARFALMVRSVVEGRFREERRGILRRWHKHEFLDPRGNVIAGGAISVPIHERAFFDKGRRVWKSWPRR